MSNLSVHLDDYLKLRRQLGFKLKCEANLLHNFLRFAEGKRARFITTKLALEWAIAPANIKPERRATRLGVVRRFAKYVSSMDPRTEVPSPKLLPGQFRRRPPYLYQNDDIRRLIEVARRFDPSDELKNDTLATVLGLLAVTGMRVGEALVWTAGTSISSEVSDNSSCQGKQIQIGASPSIRARCPATICMPSGSTFS